MVKVCIFRERKYGAWFCSREGINCGPRKLASCIVAEVASRIYCKGGREEKNEKKALSFIKR